MMNGQTRGSQAAHSAGDARTRGVSRLVVPEHTADGAGVRLRRSIASRALDYLDPFLLLDEFKSDDPDDYIAGFPMHPHRGIETVTYMLSGEVQHRDTLGNAGVIGPGDVQWMTAGRAIMHEEMPHQRGGLLHGFQLWVNLPARLKMRSPRYQEVSADRIPALTLAGGVTVRVIAGQFGGTEGAVTGIEAEPTYLDVSMAPRSEFAYLLPHDQAAFAYVYDGAAIIGDTSVEGPMLAVLGDGDAVTVRTGDEAARFLLISGKPLDEPIARYGPFVMNTSQEIEQTLRELRDGTFL